VNILKGEILAKPSISLFEMHGLPFTMIPGGYRKKLPTEYHGFVFEK
jgi:hypothetical protein